MTSRGHPLPSSMTRHGPSLGSFADVNDLVDTRLPPELAEKKLVAEIERLASENQRLAAAQIALRRDLVFAQEDVQKINAHIRSVQTESDIQIRVILEKAAKMEADYKDGATLKKEIEQAHKEARRLVVARQDLIDEIEEANKVLNAARLDIKRLPDMLAELDNMREEHHRLRTSFEHQKHSNIRKVEQLYGMEKELISMAKEVERLKAEVANAEKDLKSPPTTAPYVVPYPNSDPSHQTMAAQSNGPYYDPYGMPLVQMGAFPVDRTISYVNSSTAPGMPPVQMGAIPGHGMFSYPNYSTASGMPPAHMGDGMISYSNYSTAPGMHPAHMVDRTISYANTSTTPGMPPVQSGAVPVHGTISHTNSSPAPPPPPYDPPPPDDPPPPAYDPPLPRD